MASAPAILGTTSPLATDLHFRPAQRLARPARVLIEGAPGSGRTPAALALSAALGTRRAVIDTDGSANRRDSTGFNILELTSFAPDQLLSALYIAGSQRYEVVAIDSLSAWWSGRGGLLELVDQAAAAAGPKAEKNIGWIAMRPTERRMTDALAAFPGHVVATARSTTETLLEVVDGQTIPRQYALRPELRPGAESDFDVVLTMLPGHSILVRKSRVPNLPDGTIYSGESVLSGAAYTDMGAAILAWTRNGINLAPEDWYAAAQEPQATERQLIELELLLERTRMEGMAAREHDGTLCTLGDLVRNRIRIQREARERAEKEEAQERRRLERSQQPAGRTPPQYTNPETDWGAPAGAWPAPNAGWGSPAGTWPNPGADWNAAHGEDTSAAFGPEAESQGTAPGSEAVSRPQEIDAGDGDDDVQAVAGIVNRLMENDGWSDLTRVLRAAVRATELGVNGVRVPCADDQTRPLGEVLKARTAELKVPGS
ncbi:AAA family ATPase [Kitasatospora sp. NPDC088783]|uniref:AAA family ATPase n=1 Tax=Kitasatospora sp. NPDC088783 TaxID=3364077 RepID=UPI00381BD933